MIERNPVRHTVFRAFTGPSDAEKPSRRDKVVDNAGTSTNDKVTLHRVLGRTGERGVSCAWTTKDREIECESRMELDTG